MRKYFRPADDAVPWNALWDTTQFEEVHRAGGTNFLTAAFHQYFPKDGKILEAGCGLGQYVAVYQQQGYDIEGVDNSPIAIQKIKERFPDLPVRLADIRELPYASKSVAIYFSGGVLEHFEQGPWEALKEAHRVLRDDGHLIMTVPWMNLARRVGDLMFFRRPEDYVRVQQFMVQAPLKPGWQFYQYCFERAEILRVLRQAGFKAISARGVSIVWGMKKLLNRQRGTWIPKPGTLASHVRSGVHQRPSLKSLLLLERSENRILDALLSVLGLSVGHMLLIVCQKDGPV